METIEYRTEDKANWGAGPWCDEADKKQWKDEATGYPCLIVRNPAGALCGYVGITVRHPHYGQDYEAPDVSVHGGLTFADRCSHGSEETGICHKAEGPDDIWWFGFDCLHSGDSSPPINIYSFNDGVYRDFAYVTAQVTSLAAQLKALEP